MTLRRLGWKFWLAAGILVIGVIWLIALSGGESDPSQPVGEVAPGEPPEEPGMGAGQPLTINITADRPARIAAVGRETLDLGSTPTQLAFDQLSVWNITGFDEASSKQQEIVKELDPGQALAVHFEFADSRRWSNPIEARSGLVSQPLFDAGDLVGLNQERLERLDLDYGSTDDGQFDNPDPLQTVVWRDSSNYLTLSVAGQLRLVRPEGGWTITGVRSLTGNGRLAGWLADDGQVELFDWTERARTQPGIINPDASLLFIGQGGLYLFGWDDSLDIDQGYFHPTGWLEIYDLGSGGSRGRIGAPGPPQVMADLGRYSFWLLGNEAVVIDNQTAGRRAGWDFSRPVADLTAGLDHRDQAIVYLLTETGEVWDFSPDRQTYNLVGRAPTGGGASGVGVVSSLVQTDETIYFGFRWLGPNPRDQTYRLDLAGP